MRGYCQWNWCNCCNSSVCLKGKRPLMQCSNIYFYDTGMHPPAQYYPLLLVSHPSFYPSWHQYLQYLAKWKEKESLMRGPHLNKRLRFKMSQLFSEAKLAPAAKGGTSNHLDVTFLNLAQFWSISRTPWNNGTEGKGNLPPPRHQNPLLSFIA